MLMFTSCTVASPFDAAMRGRTPRLAHAVRYLERIEVSSAGMSTSEGTSSVARAESFVVGNTLTKAITCSRASSALARLARLGDRS